MFNPILIPSLFSLIMILVTWIDIREDVKSGLLTKEDYGWLALALLVKPGLLIAIVWAMFYASFYSLPR